MLHSVNANRETKRESGEDEEEPEEEPDEQTEEPPKRRGKKGKRARVAQIRRLAFDEGQVEDSCYGEMPLFNRDEVESDDDYIVGGVQVKGRELRKGKY